MFTALLLAAVPVTISFDNQLLQFKYSWSAEANAIPTLRRRFEADAASTRAEALKSARDDRQARLKSGGKPGDWNGHDFSRSWETAGQSVRLLSLEGDTSAYTGGAHPNSGTTALLWDRKLNREIKLDNLLLRAGWWSAALRRPFCILLDRERTKRRQEPVRKDDMFGNCPELGELTLTLEDRNSNARFDHVRVTADAYVAGPYVEGSYDISLPITAPMLGRVKPVYRTSFEAQPPVQ